MSNLGADCFVGKLTYNELVPAVAPANQIVSVAGFFNNAFSQTAGEDHMEWVSNATPDTVLPCIVLPYDCVLKSFTTRWLGTGPVAISAGESWKIDIGTLTPNTPANQTNWNTLTGGTGIQTWDKDDNNTYPQKSSEDINLTLTKGTAIELIGFESGSITPNTGEVQAFLTFEII